MINILASPGSPESYVEDFAGNRFPNPRQFLPIIVYAWTGDEWTGWVTSYGTN